MKAIVLAAGRGSRMKYLTDDKPKCLVEFQGKPLLEWQLSALRSSGLSNVAIVTGYRRELLANLGLVEFHNPRWAVTNMVSSLACAEDWLKSDTCIVSYSDIYYSADTVACLLTTDADLCITYDPNWLQLWSKRFADPLDDAETFRIDTSIGKILEIGKRPQSIEEIQGQFMGLILFKPNAWRALQRIRAKLGSQDCAKLDMTSGLQFLIESGFQVSGVPITSKWGEFDSKDDILNYFR